MVEAGLEPATSADIDEAYALVQRLIGPPLASSEVMRSVQEHTRASIFLVREDGRITGVLGELALSSAGLAALEAGAFDGTAPELAHLARPGAPVAAYYCWGLAAETRRASIAGVKGVVAARDTVYANLPFFARAAEPKGEDANKQSHGARVGFRRFDCTYYPGQPGLLYSPMARSVGRSAA